MKKADIRLDERVAFYIHDRDKINYYGRARFVGRVLRGLPTGLFRVEMEGTGSQDTEGFNDMNDVHPKSMRKLKDTRRDSRK